MREHPDGVGDARQRDLERDGDLLFHFLRRVPGKQRDHRRLDVRDVGKRFDGQRSKRDNAGGNEQPREQQEKQRLIECERDASL